MWTGTHWDWLIIGAGYVLGLAFFQVLGGLRAASRGIQSWGRAHGSKRAKELGLIRS